MTAALADLFLNRAPAGAGRGAEGWPGGDPLPFHRALPGYAPTPLVDAPAIALYSKHGVREDVLHFDLPPRAACTPRGRIDLANETRRV